jgi:hypothetical protein
MCYKPLVKLLALLLLPFPALACDWTVRQSVDPMTDARVCWVDSRAAEISFYVRGADRPRVITGSAYSRPAVTVRIDDNPPIRMHSDVTGALDALLPQLQTGTRIRTLVEDYPVWREGDAAICNLPALLASCAP